MRVVGRPTVASSFAPPMSMAFGTDQQAVSALVGAVFSVVERHRISSHDTPLFRIADLSIGDGTLAVSVVDAFRAHGRDASAMVRVCGTETDATALEQAREALMQRDALGVLGVHDASSSPAAELRNKLECAGGADVVVYAHAAYPHRLPSFKLSRMVDRLGDMAAPHGAVITLHNHGPSDIEDIRRQVLGQPVHSAIGVNCNTQGRLEAAFDGAKLYSFSVTVPNMVALPANMKAVKALFDGEEKSLSGKDAADAAIIRETLEVIAGGRERFAEALAGMDEAARQQASHYFAERIRHAGGRDLPLTVGGGQVVMAFRSQNVAQEAFAAASAACQEMSPPAIALPITREVMPEFDKQSAHKDWKSRLADHGIVNPPRVCQSGLDSGRSR